MKRIAVVGAGEMGKNHVRVCHEMADVELVGVADTNEDALANVRRLYNVPIYTNYMEMVERVRPEALSVVVPTVAHYTVVRHLLEADCHVLVEKPIAAELAEAEQLIRIAARRKRVLMVGHIERFNPAIIALKARLDRGELGRVFQIHARRMGPFPTRVRDVGVIMDLATHDLDIMRFLSGSEVTRLYAETNREIHSACEDMLDGIVRFANGTVGLLEINWLTPTKIRELYVTGECGLFRVDYITQDLTFYENAAASGNFWSSLSLLRGVSEGAMIKYPILKHEPLRAELESFVAEVRSGGTSVANGLDGHAALALAIGLVESAKTGSVKHMNGLNENSELSNDRNQSNTRQSAQPPLWNRVRQDISADQAHL